MNENDVIAGGVDMESILANKTQTISYWQSKMQPPPQPPLRAAADLPAAPLLPPPAFQNNNLILGNDEFVEVGSITVEDVLLVIDDDAVPPKKHYVYGAGDVVDAAQAQPSAPVVTYFHCGDQPHHDTWVIAINLI